MTRRQRHYQQVYAHVQRMRHVREVHEVITTGILAGYVRPVPRPDGQIGYQLTPEGRQALKDQL